MPQTPPQQPPHWYKAEKESLKLPENLPDVATLPVWLARVTTALVEASIYSDEAEVAWLARANDPSVTFDMLSDSGGARFTGLDSMLAAGLQSKIQSGELYLRLKKEMVLAMNRKHS